jgi:methanogenic corrinoid protein MtbC1
MKDTEIKNLIEDYLAQDGSPDVIADHFTKQMISAGLNYDLPAFEKSFSACFLKLGIKDTYTKVIYPFLSKVGIMWRKDDLCPAQEHFVSNLVRQKLFTIIDALPSSSDSNDKWILFLPEDEEHEIGLLYSYFMLRSMNKDVIYLGSRVPVDSLKDAVSKTGATNLFFFYVAANSEENLEKYINTLSREFKKQTIYISGNIDVLKKIKFKANIKHVKSPEDLNEFVLKKWSV